MSVNSQFFDAATIRQTKVGLMTFGHKYRLLRKKLDFYVGVFQGIPIYFKCLWPEVLEHCHRTQHNDNSAQQCSFIMLIVVEFLFPRERRNISSREIFFSLYLIILFRLPSDRKSWLLLGELEFQPSFGTSLSTLITVQIQQPNLWPISGKAQR